jgi:bifunctional non-homologous end joining protein LigD
VRLYVPLQRRKTLGAKAQFPGLPPASVSNAGDRVPRGARWIHEIKFDGYRVQVHMRDGTVTVYPRCGHDWTKRFKKVAADVFEIDAGATIIDGEVVVPSAHGFFCSSKRTKRPINIDRAGRIRFALSEWI